MVSVFKTRPTSDKLGRRYFCEKTSCSKSILLPAALVSFAEKTGVLVDGRKIFGLTN